MEKSNKYEIYRILLPFGRHIQRLHLVVAERYAGNVEATTPVILQILKDLKGVKYLTDGDIANTCKELCIPFGSRGTVAT